MNMHVTAYHEERETVRQTRLHKVNFAASDIARHSLLTIGGALPEFHEAEMHAAFLKLAGHLGYSVQIPSKKDAA